ncbi:hypothetical protein BDZ97DRAFT_1341106 [Flammula alnicola]|nr:hypothetical protein BDZ97DRAFT_1341106 [Flammula alnicola]
MWIHFDPGSPVLRSLYAASCLLQTFRSKPRAYFENIVKSLAFDSTVTLSQAKPILVELSRRILLFSMFRTNEAPETFLGYIWSPYLRRLTMIRKSSTSTPVYHPMKFLLKRCRLLPILPSSLAQNVPPGRWHTSMVRFDLLRIRIMQYYSVIGWLSKTSLVLQYPLLVGPFSFE